MTQAKAGWLVAGLIALALSAGVAAADDDWKVLFDGKDLSAWTNKAQGGWKVEDGAIAWQKKCGYLWSKAKFGNFLLWIEFKVSPGCNSGLFIRTANPRNPVQTGMEIQVLDSHGKAKPGKHDCGALYDAQAPKGGAYRKPGEWNQMLVMCAGSHVGVILNGKMILDVDLDKWTEARKNPDGSKNKYKTPLKEFPRAGHLGVQDHGKAVWFRNVKIIPLKTCPKCQESGGFCPMCQKANGPVIEKAMKAALMAGKPKFESP